MSSNDDLDINLEPAVLLALSKLQRMRRSVKKQQTPSGVSCKKIVEFLKANFPWVDGDVESQLTRDSLTLRDVLAADITSLQMTASCFISMASSIMSSCEIKKLISYNMTNKHIYVQRNWRLPLFVLKTVITVMTALLSCVKTGIVCALDNHKFLLIRATANKMISNCVSRVSHGPKCSCLLMLKSLLKTFPPSCCYLKRKPVRKLKKSPTKLKPGSKPKSLPRRKKSKSGRKNCAQKAQNQIGTSKSALSLKENVNEKCNYCMEIHSLPRLKKLCMTCYPIGNLNPVPADKFSPRDEHTSTAENIITNVVGTVA